MFDYLRFPSFSRSISVISVLGSHSLATGVLANLKLSCTRDPSWIEYLWVVFRCCSTASSAISQRRFLDYMLYLACLNSKERLVFVIRRTDKGFLLLILLYAFKLTKYLSCVLFIQLFPICQPLPVGQTDTVHIGTRASLIACKLFYLPQHFLPIRYHNAG